VHFDVTDQLLIRYSTFVRYYRQNGSTMGQYISYLWEEGSYDSVKTEALYNIPNEFGTIRKLEG